MPLEARSKLGPAIGPKTGAHAPGFSDPPPA